MDRPLYAGRESRDDQFEVGSEGQELDPGVAFGRLANGFNALRGCRFDDDHVRTGFSEFGEAEIRKGDHAHQVEAFGRGKEVDKGFKDDGPIVHQQNPGALPAMRASHSLMALDSSWPEEGVKGDSSRKFLRFLGGVDGRRMAGLGKGIEKIKNGEITGFGKSRARARSGRKG